MKNYVEQVQYTSCIINPLGLIFTCNKWEEEEEDNWERNSQAENVKLLQSREYGACFLPGPERRSGKELVADAKPRKVVYKQLLTASPVGGCIFPSFLLFLLHQSGRHPCLQPSLLLLLLREQTRVFFGPELLCWRRYESETERSYYFSWLNLCYKKQLGRNIDRKLLRDEDLKERRWIALRCEKEGSGSWLLRRRRQPWHGGDTQQKQQQQQLLLLVVATPQPEQYHQLLKKNNRREEKNRELWRRKRNPKLIWHWGSVARRRTSDDSGKVKG